MKPMEIKQEHIEFVKELSTDYRTTRSMLNVYNRELELLKTKIQEKSNTLNALRQNEKRFMESLVDDFPTEYLIAFDEYLQNKGRIKI